MIWLRRAEVAAAGRTQTKVRPRGKQFQKMDCAAPASFTHTHDMRGLHPPLPAKRGNWRRAKRTPESSFFSPRRPPPPAMMNWRKGSNSREKCVFLPTDTAVWRKGSANVTFSFLSGE